MRHVPWVTLIAALVFFVMPPLGLGLIYFSFYMENPLDRLLNQVLLLMIFGAIVVLAMIEIAIKLCMNRRTIRRACGG